MSVVDKTTLKTYFNTGDVPTEANFASLIDALPRFIPDEPSGNATTDTANLQSAINEASVSGGVVSLLGRTYSLARQGTTTLGPQSGVDYSLWVNADNVYIEGPGTLVLESLPSLTSGSFALIIFGDGDIDALNSIYPDQPAGNPRLNVGIRNIIVDASALSNAEREQMQDRLGSACFIFSFCYYWFVEGCTIFNGWGYDGAINGNLASRYAKISKNNLFSPQYGGIWCDGGAYVNCSENYITSPGRLAINFQGNGDSHQDARRNVIIGNIITYLPSSGVGISMTASVENLLTGNLIHTTGSSVSAITMTADSNAFENYPSNNNEMTNNIMLREGAVGANNAIQINGIAVSEFDGQPVFSENNLIAGNKIDIGWTTGIKFQYAKKNDFIANSIRALGLPFNGVTGTLNEGNIARENIIVTSSSAWGKFTSGDTSPSAFGTNLWQTNNSVPTTITMFDDGYRDQSITILIKDNNTTFDFSGTNLLGNQGSDWSPASGDWLSAVFDGTKWYCTIYDNTP